MIQDIAPHHYHNEYHHFEIQKGDCVLFYRKREVLLAYDDEQIVYPKYEEISKKEARQYSYLFRIDDCRYFLCGEIDETLLDLYILKVFRRCEKHSRNIRPLQVLQVFSWQNGTEAGDFADAVAL